MSLEAAWTGGLDWRPGTAVDLVAALVVEWLGAAGPGGWETIGRGVRDVR
jgi:hypothetical protein